MLATLTVLLVSLAITLAAIPPTRKAAFRWDLVDRPDGRRKLHGRTVALGGGVATYFGWLIPLVAVALWGGAGKLLQSGDGAIWGSDRVPGETLRYAGLAAATGCLVLLGLFDDHKALRGRQKLVGQAFAVGLIVLSGTLVERLRLFGVTIELGLLAAPFTAFFLLGSINAFNLLDGLDGLAGLTGTIIASAFCAMALLNPVGGPTALVSAALVGSLLGFLFYNRPPASIFLGDAGSLWIGLALGFVAIHSGPGRGGEWEAGALALVAPIAVWSIPIFDVAVAIVRRKLSGRSIYSADRGHLHHRLKINRKLSESRVLLTIGGLCTVTAVAAVVGVALESEWIAAVGALAVPAGMVATRLFGFEEVVLLSKRTGGAARSLVPKQTVVEEVRGGRHCLDRLPDDPAWTALWNQLLEHVDRFSFVTVRLEIDARGWQDASVVQWNRHGERPDDRELLRVDLPLGCEASQSGRLRVTAEPSEESAVERLTEIVDVLAGFERELLELLAPESKARPAASAAPRRAPFDRRAASLRPVELVTAGHSYKRI